MPGICTSLETLFAVLKSNEDELLKVALTGKAKRKFADIALHWGFPCKNEEMVSNLFVAADVVCNLAL